MRTDALRKSSSAYGLWHVLLMVLLCGVFHALTAQALTITVVDQNGAAVTDYRWVVEEDATKASIPGQLAGADNLSLSFHTSYMPVVASGRVGSAATPANGPDLADIPATKRYYVSVLPDGGGYQMGGAPVAVGQSARDHRGQQDAHSHRTDFDLRLQRQPADQRRARSAAGTGTGRLQHHPQGSGRHLRPVRRPGHPGCLRQSDRHDLRAELGQLRCRSPYSAATGFCLDANGAPKCWCLGNGFVTSGPDGVVQHQESGTRQIHHRGEPACRHRLAPDLHHRGHQGHRRLGEGQRAVLSSRNSGRPGITWTSASSERINDATRAQRRQHHHRQGRESAHVASAGLHLLQRRPGTRTAGSA